MVYNLIKEVFVFSKDKGALFLLRIAPFTLRASQSPEKIRFSASYVLDFDTGGNSQNYCSDSSPPNHLGF